MLRLFLGNEPISYKVKNSCFLPQLFTDIAGKALSCSPPASPQLIVFLLKKTVWQENGFAMNIIKL